MKEVALTKGKTALVDDEDLWMFLNHNWNCTKHGYVCRNYFENGKWKCHRMHRMVMNARDGELVDHINRNRLDNRKCNLRIVNKSQNAANKAAHRNNKLGMRGVHFHPGTGKFRAVLGSEGKRISLGLYPTPQEAHSAYCKAATKKWGEYFSA
jgi:hypothetical protein